MKNIIIFLFLNFFIFCTGQRLFSEISFSKDFLFGVSTASYQIEGAWDVADKGENIWDHWVHSNPSPIFDKSTGDVACNSYNLWERDIEMLKELGVDHYRFSISWSRILPNGFTDKISETGIQYYNNLINGLLDAEIIPMVTIYHWDLPQPLQEIGGWPNRQMADYYEDYAKILFDNFGDRVKIWITFNEPRQTCQQGYGTPDQAPGLNFSGIADYLCAHTVLLAHSRVYHLYNDTYRSVQNGKIGITLNTNWIEPSSTRQEDLDAAERALQFNFGWYANPIFSKEGDYPEIMRRTIDKRSKDEGYRRSRLPYFSQSEVKSLIGTSDFLGLNHYTTNYATDAKNMTQKRPLYSEDIGAVSSVDPAWPGSASNWLKVVPWGFRKLLNRIKELYDNPAVIITENGYSTHLGIKDVNRTMYLQQYLLAMMEAMKDGCNIKGYTYWSLMDNFEWERGYSERFGLFEVDFKSPNRTRTMRDSGRFFSNIIYIRKLLVGCPSCNYDFDLNYNVISVNN